MYQRILFLFILIMHVTHIVEAQDIIVTKQGSPITAYNVEVSENYIFYTLIPQKDGTISRIMKDSVLIVRQSNGSVLDLMKYRINKQNEIVDNSETSFADIDEKNIHGNLIAKGNCVYIPTNSSCDYEQAGQEVLREFMKNWGYWKIVNKPEQAHFILQYTIQIKGRDCSHLVIRPRKYFKLNPVLFYTNESHGMVVKPTWNARGSVGVVVNYKYCSEDINDNIKIAENLGDHFKKIILEPDKGDGKRFFKTNQSALNADSESNDTSEKMPWGIKAN